jgi:hypothetical protein
MHQRDEERLEKRWIIHYQDQMSFSEFRALIEKNTVKKPLIEPTETDLMREAEKIMNAVWREENGIGN